MTEPKTIDKRQITAIKAGVAQAERGEFIDHAKLKVKWEKKLAAVQKLRRLK